MMLARFVIATAPQALVAACASEEIDRLKYVGFSTSRVPFSCGIFMRLLLGLGSKATHPRQIAAYSYFAATDW